MLRDLLDKAKAFATTVTQGNPPTGPIAPELGALSLRLLDGQPFPADRIAGKVVLFVNVASRCGLTPQYSALVAIDQSLRDRGFVVVGVPCNQFLGQEPGSAEAISAFCATNYGVEFPLLEKQAVNGSARSPLYQWLIGSPNGGGKDIAWNFEKFLVGRDGKVRARFAPKVVPDAPEITAAIEAALAETA